MGSKICSKCNIEKHLKEFHKNTQKLKRYYENKEKISTQRKRNYETIKG